jgi:transketolase
MDKHAFEAIALSVRSLTMDAVQKANSGHPGLPMGLAELGALLYGEILDINPKVPDWIDRDRLVLSAGHGCMLLYSLLHMAGYDISLDDIKQFRQLGSSAAGHPEYGLTPGIETTTGPLGQGFSNAVGMALAERMLAARFNTGKHRIIDHYTYAIAGDGCMMEGISSESASLAGHLGLGRLIVYYDSNRITIEGSTSLAFTEDVGTRFKGYHWHVQEGSAYDADAIVSMTREAKKVVDKPSLIILESVIAKGSPKMAGCHEAHGAPLGEDEVRASKKALGIPVDADFFIHQDALDHFQSRASEWDESCSAWKVMFEEWASENPELYSMWKTYFSPVSPADVEFPGFAEGDKIATRSASGKILNALARGIPNLIGGSADLAPSTKSMIDGFDDVQKGQYGGRNLHFGVREHAMGGVVNGLMLHGGLRPYCATFFVFSDYMRPSIRLACMMKQPVVYLFTHDSIFVGEDGPTHQPVEHFAALRAIPGMHLLRPADAQETEAAWQMALLRKDGPTALALTRQNLEVFHKDDGNWRETIKRGAYIARDSKDEPDLVVIATGSEVGLALEAARELKNAKIRVLSVLSRELFLSQPKEFITRLIPGGARRMVIETGVSFGWEGLAGENGKLITLDRFGESGPYEDVAEHLGFGRDAVVEAMKKLLP